MLPEKLIWNVEVFSCRLFWRLLPACAAVRYFLAACSDTICTFAPIRRATHTCKVVERTPFH